MPFYEIISNMILMIKVSTFVAGPTWLRFKFLKTVLRMDQKLVKIKFMGNSKKFREKSFL